MSSPPMSSISFWLKTDFTFAYPFRETGRLKAHDADRVQFFDLLRFRDKFQNVAEGFSLKSSVQSTNQDYLVFVRKELRLLHDLHN